MSESPKTWRERLAHAFAVGGEDPFTAEDVALLDRVARKVVGRCMTAPVILALQSVRPLGFLGSQAMVALKPFAELVVPVEHYDRFVKILERREGIALLIERIEFFEAENE